MVFWSIFDYSNKSKHNSIYTIEHTASILWRCRCIKQPCINGVDLQSEVLYTNMASFARHPKSLRQLVTASQVPRCVWLCGKLKIVTQEIARLGEVWWMGERLSVHDIFVFVLDCVGSCLSVQIDILHVWTYVPISFPLPRSETSIN